MPLLQHHRAGNLARTCVHDRSRRDPVFMNTSQAPSRCHQATMRHSLKQPRDCIQIAYRLHILMLSVSRLRQHRCAAQQTQPSKHAATCACLARMAVISPSPTRHHMLKTSVMGPRHTASLTATAVRHPSTRRSEVVFTTTPSASAQCRHPMILRQASQAHLRLPMPRAPRCRPPHQEPILLATSLRHVSTWVPTAIPIIPRTYSPHARLHLAIPLASWDQHARHIASRGSLKR